MRSTIRIGTRKSALARWQTDHVAELLKHAVPGLAVDVEVFSTEGDRVLDKPLPEIGGKGVFTAELEAALLEGRIDLAVHSLKDLPTEHTDGLTLGAVPERGTALDALVCPTASSLDELPAGARVGTSSLRRRGQLLAKRPDLVVEDIRGNVETRIRKTEDGTVDAAILAATGMERLKLDDKIAEHIAPDEIVPAPGQGALGVQARTSDDELLSALMKIHDPATSAEVTAERELLHALGGGCNVPLGAYATTSDGELTLLACVCGLDGSRRTAVEMSAPVAEAETLGQQAAFYLLSNGAAEIVAELR